jgi:hypothetical protein
LTVESARCTTQVEGTEGFEGVNGVLRLGGAAEQGGGTKYRARRGGLAVQVGASLDSEAVPARCELTRADPNPTRRPFSEIALPCFMLCRGHCVSACYMHSCPPEAAPSGLTGWLAGCAGRDTSRFADPLGLGPGMEPALDSTLQK